MYKRPDHLVVYSAKHIYSLNTMFGRILQEKKVELLHIPWYDT
jgi:hypothetical protein